MKRAFSILYQHDYSFNDLVLVEFNVHGNAAAQYKDIRYKDVRYSINIQTFALKALAASQSASRELP